jgi:hypothetical protein
MSLSEGEEDLTVGDFFPLGKVGEVPEEARVEGAYLIKALERIVEDGCHTEEGAGEGIRQCFACFGGKGKATEVGLTASASIG